MLNASLFSIQSLASSTRYRVIYLFHITVSPVGSCGDDLHILISDSRLCKICFLLCQQEAVPLAQGKILTANVVEVFFEFTAWTLLELNHSSRNQLRCSRGMRPMRS